MEGGAGARTVSIEGGDTKFIKINSDPNSVWHSELTEETPSDPSFGSVTMAPKTVLSMTEVSRELLQDSANVEEALSTAFVGSLNDAILSATFTGSGANTPTGLASTVTQTNEYSNGSSPDWTNFVGASKTLHDNNVPEDNRSFIHAPDTWEDLALITDNNGRYQDAPSFIRDVPNYTSSGVSAGEAYVGDFSNVVYGFRLNITMEQHPSALAKSYGSLWMAAARLDIATFRPSALVRIEEATA
jgi:HK97 family phage major capsid protein